MYWDYKVQRPQTVQAAYETLTVAANFLGTLEKSDNDLKEVRIGASHQGQRFVLTVRCTPEEALVDGCTLLIAASTYQRNEGIVIAGAIQRLLYTYDLLAAGAPRNEVIAASDDALPTLPSCGAVLLLVVVCPFLAVFWAVHSLTYCLNRMPS